MVTPMYCMNVLDAKSGMSSCKTAEPPNIETPEIALGMYALSKASLGDPFSKLKHLGTLDPIWAHLEVLLKLLGVSLEPS